MIRIFVLISFFSSVVSAAGQAPSVKVLDYYPACDYKIIDTVTVKQRLGSKFEYPKMKELNEATLVLIEKVRERAIEVGADSIAIIDKAIFDHEQANKSNLRGYVQLTAQLFNHCDEQGDVKRRRTPYDANGTRQMALKTQTLATEFKIETVVKIGGKKTVRPALSQMQLTTDNSFYGLKIGASFEDVMAKLGTPTSEFLLVGDQKVISYGRRLWLVFEEQSLVYVTNQNHWLSTEIVNMFEFDERIADQDWLLHDEFRMGMELTSDELTPLGEKMSSDRVRLSSTEGNESVYLLFESEEHQTTDLQTHKITGFGFGAENKRLWTLPVKQSPGNADTYQKLNNLIKEKITAYEPVHQQDIEASPILVAQNQNQEKLLVINNQLVLEFDNQSLSNIHLIESVLSKESRGDSAGWQFAGVRQGQSKEAIRNHFGDKVFEMGNTWEVAHDGFTQEVYFYEVDGKSRALASLVSIY
ncbi:hypothetical protein [Planctobacterium marinum]|uniref:Uncharacterized protein n=1 Tax=Planctobacterium marinum TaxID=1631968 RepID=A0AA48HLF1_9ALTE|nr:hypothetical protein MACH26_01380 [Planctobacterium marinum]